MTGAGEIVASMIGAAAVALLMAGAAAVAALLMAGAAAVAALLMAGVAAVASKITQDFKEKINKYLSID